MPGQLLGRWEATSLRPPSPLFIGNERDPSMGCPSDGDLLNCFHTFRELAPSRTLVRVPGRHLELVEDHHCTQESNSKILVCSPAALSPHKIHQNQNQWHFKYSSCQKRRCSFRTTRSTPIAPPPSRGADGPHQERDHHGGGAAAVPLRHLARRGHRPGARPRLEAGLMSVVQKSLKNFFTGKAAVGM